MRLVFRLPRVTALFPAASGQGVVVSVLAHGLLLTATVVAASLGGQPPPPGRVYTVAIISDVDPPSGGDPAPAPARTEAPAPEPLPTPRPAPAEREPVEKPRPPAEKRPEPRPRPTPAPVESGPPAAPDPGAASPAEPDPPPDSGSEPGGGGSGLASGNGGGGVPTIDSEAFPFAYYRRALISRLRAAWSRPLAPPGLTVPLRTTLRFEILRGGAIVDVQTVQESGFVPLDRSALRAVYDAQVPPLPEEFEGERLAVSFYFELTPGS